MDDLTPDDEEYRLIDMHGLTKGQLSWRRAKIMELGGGEMGRHGSYANTHAQPMKLLTIQMMAKLSRQVLPALLSAVKSRQ